MLSAKQMNDVDALSIVDPQGLVTLHWDGWSLDVWMMDIEASLGQVEDRLKGTTP